VVFGALGLAFIVDVIVTAGARLPRDHRATRTVRLPGRPEQVWPVITRIAEGASVPVDVVEHDPPRRLVTRVKESEKQFGGTWTIAIMPAEGGSTVTIIEEGWVASPLFRFISFYVIGHYASMDALLKKVEREVAALEIG
jgi:hypothetical protein